MQALVATVDITTHVLNSTTATRTATIAFVWKYPLVSCRKAMDSVRTDIQTVQITHHHVLGRTAANILLERLLDGARAS